MSAPSDMEPSKGKRFLKSSIIVTVLLVAGLVFGRTSSAQEDQPTALSYNSQTMPILKSSGYILDNGPIALDSGVFLAEVGPFGATYDAVPNGGSIVRYRVRPGDTIDGIANLFDVSKNTILWANDIDRNSVLAVDQELIILPVSGLRYVTVKNGETVSSIVKRFGGDVEEIIYYNGLEKEALDRGVEIIIPDGELVAIPSLEDVIPKKTPSAPSANTKVPVKKLPVSASITELSDPTGFFGLPLQTGIRTQRIHGYNGVDIGVPIGTPVYAAASGTVIVAKNSGYNGGYGLYLVIAHDNGLQTLYAHLSKNLVTQGAVVRKGEQVALSGNTGRSTGPHLHFEVRGRGAKNFLAQ